ncbi:MAG: Hsp20/alpha crystallin family protein [Ignavibacteriales bacterium]|nr:Hsp20/alpha crystallin family protein [Ignavibacteriales bacterium]
MSLIRFNPVRELLSVEREFSRLFNELENKFGIPTKQGTDSEMENAVWMPVTDSYENEKGYELNLEIPGIKKEDVKISLVNGALRISGERNQSKSEENGKFHRVERVYGKFFRSFNLPEGIKEDAIEAEFHDGQLTVQIPKAEEVRPKELQIKVK